MYRDLLSVYDTPGLSGATDVCVVDTYAYIVDGDVLEILDVSDPSTPTLIGINDKLISAQHIEVSDNTAYIISETTGLVIMSVLDPTAPQIIGNAPEYTGVIDIETGGSTLYLAAEQDGLLILDVTNPESPTLLGSASEGELVEDVHYDGISTVYAVGEGRGLRIFDVSDPSSPYLLSTYNSVQDATHITVENSTAYISNDYEVVAVDISDPTNPSHLGSISLDHSAGQLLAIDAEVYLSSQSRGLEIINFSNPSSPVLVRSYWPYFGIISPRLAVQNSIAYVANQSRGLVLIDISNREANPLIGRWNEGLGQYGSSILDGNLLYLSRGRRGLDILDVSDPATPLHIANIPALGEIGDFARSGDILYVVHNLEPQNPADGQLLIAYQVNGPGKLIQVGQYQFEGRGSSIVVEGTIAYLSGVRYLSSGGYLDIIDFSTPSSPQSVSKTYVPTWGAGIALKNNTAYMNAIETGLYIFDVSDRTLPVTLGLYPLDFAGGLEVKDDTAFVGALYSIEVIDVGDPTAPIAISSMDDLNTFVDHISGDRAFVPDGSVFKIYDISKPAMPTLTGIYSTRDEGGASVGGSVQVAGSLAYLVDRSAGLFVLDIGDCADSCLADLNNDGALNFFDVTAFIAAFANEDPLADITSDNLWNFYDVSQFLKAYIGGCP
jgi:hypothetical protein